MSELWSHQPGTVLTEDVHLADRLVSTLPLAPNRLGGLWLLTVILPLDKGFPLTKPLHADTVDDTWRLLCLESLVQLGEQRRTETCRKDLVTPEIWRSPFWYLQGSLAKSQRTPYNSTMFLTACSCSLEQATDQDGFKLRVHMQPCTALACSGCTPRAASTGEPQNQSPSHAVDHIPENVGRTFPLTVCDRSPLPTPALCHCCQMFPVQTLMKVSISILLRLASASISTWQIEHTYRWFTAGPPPNLRTERGRGMENSRRGEMLPSPASYGDGFLCHCRRCRRWCSCRRPLTAFTQHKGHNIAWGQCIDTAHFGLD